MQEEITLRPGRREDAPEIAGLIVMAMTDECCRHFYGERHTAADFLRLITDLAAREDTQYSFRNAICATDRDGGIAGVSVSYDGARLIELRRPFIEEALARFGIDHSGMTPETQAGETYLDSLAVHPQYRGRGIAGMLLKATAERARTAGAGPLGLLVDEGNPKAERLYVRSGFREVGRTAWGGHGMKHMQMD